MQPDKARRPALGRGLSALIPQASAPVATVNAPVGASSRAQVFNLAIEAVHRDEHQPRRHFDSAKLDELAASVKQKGIIQPILVRKLAQGGGYKIIAGERRWRAAQLAGLKEIPAIVKEVSEPESFELALIENLQREDLNPIEEAEGYKRLIDEHHLTQEVVAQRVGKDRSTIANALRLLQLPVEIKHSLIDGSLNMGHARALLGLTDPKKMKEAALDVVHHKLSVRATEGLVRKLKGEAGTPRTPVAPKAESPQVRDLTERLQRALGTRCKIVDHAGSGHVELSFGSYEELDRLIQHMLGERRK
ncbi:MAG: ParB/RepB/Spo0J family partition protein [Deltaproteobacteria bacterium]|nr:ParB/RepB/Spo0J family partition protein [Deltaproteobacteria bacterium]